jgi:hypothetical protein
MKKFLLLFIIILFFSQCQISVRTREAAAQDAIGSPEYQDHPATSWTVQKDDVTYRVFSFGTGYNSAAIYVVNVTKERLEIEKLKLEIAKIRGY